MDPQEITDPSDAKNHPSSDFVLSQLDNSRTWRSPAQNESPIRKDQIDPLQDFASIFNFTPRIAWKAKVHLAYFRLARTPGNNPQKNFNPFSGRFRRGTPEGLRKDPKTYKIRLHLQFKLYFLISEIFSETATLTSINALPLMFGKNTAHRVLKSKKSSLVKLTQRFFNLNPSPTKSNGIPYRYQANNCMSISKNKNCVGLDPTGRGTVYHYLEFYLVIIIKISKFYPFSGNLTFLADFPKENYIFL